MNIEPQPNGFGASITGVDLSQQLSDDTVRRIRKAWLRHMVLCFPNQPLTLSELERFTRYFGEYGDDPYVTPIDGHPNVIEIRREAQENASPFGSSWHSDWSFQATPPSATILHAREVPPYGGDTLYADGYRAFDALTAELRARCQGLTAIHSARRPYSHAGFVAGGGKHRSMKIRPSDTALATQRHPVVRTHPETQRKALWVNPVYTVGIEGLGAQEGQALIQQLCGHALRDEFIYRHRWQPHMLTMWDNRCVQHCAQGGYDGHRRIMYRTTVAGDAPC